MQEFTKRAAEVATISLASSYVIGFLIVNTYLLSYGYSGNLLFQIKYISAGALFLSLTLVLALYTYCVFWATQPIPNTEPITQEQRWKTILFSTGGALFILYWVLENVGCCDIRRQNNELQWLFWSIWAAGMAINIVQGSKLNWPLANRLRKYFGLPYLFWGLALLVTWFKVSVLGFIPLLLLAIWIVLQRTIGQEENIGKSLKTWPIGTVWDIGSIITCTLSAVLVYSLTFYGHAKPQFGGGHPANVRVIVSEEKRNQLGKLGEVERIEKLLNNASLIDSSDRDYVLLIKTDEDGGERLLQLDRGMVDAVLYLQQ